MPEDERDGTGTGRDGPTRRKSPRYPVNLRFRWSDGDRSGQAFSRQLAEGGAFLKTDIPFDADEALQVAFALPGETSSIRCRARVCYCLRGGRSGRAVGVGLEFVDMEDEDRKRLAVFLERGPG